MKRTNKTLFDLWFFVFSPLAVYFAPSSPLSSFLVVLVSTFSIIWLALRVATFVDRRSRYGCIGEVVS